MPAFVWYSPRDDATVAPLPLVEPLAIDVPLVTASGALIKDPLNHRTLFCAEYNPGVLAGALRIVDTAGFEPLLYADTYALGFDYYCRHIELERPELAEFFRMNPDFHRLLPTLVEDPPPGIFSCLPWVRAEMLVLQTELEHAIRVICTYMCCEVRPIWATCAKSPLRA